MKVRYRNDLYGNYMLIEIPEDIDTNQYTFKMLRRNKIEGVLSCKERMEDGKFYLYVDISNKKSMIQEYEEKEMQLEDMILIFQKLIQILEELRKYLLGESMVIMNPGYIFKDIENNDLYVLLLPWKMEDRNFHDLAEFFLEKINHKDENGVNAAYLFYRQQNQPQFSVYQFLSILEKESILKRQKIKNTVPTQTRKAEVLEENQKDSHQNISFQDSFDTKIWNEENINYGHKDKKKIKIALIFLFLLFLVISFLPIITSILKMSCIALALLFLIIFFVVSFEKEKEAVKKELPIEEIEMKETIFFDSYEKEECLKLQWKEKGRRKQFVLENFPCTIGKMKEEVSLVIADISVSRVHCKFIKKENKICIMDLNSTNGTFLNGLPVKNGEIQEIEKNDKILIGKVEVNVV